MTSRAVTGPLAGLGSSRTCCRERRSHTRTDWSSEPAPKGRTKRCVTYNTSMEAGASLPPRLIIAFAGGLVQNSGGITPTWHAIMEQRM
jgi:hypothetical protein